MLHNTWSSVCWKRLLTGRNVAHHWCICLIFINIHHHGLKYGVIEEIQVSVLDIHVQLSTHSLYTLSAPTVHFWLWYYRCFSTLILLGEWLGWQLLVGIWDWYQFRKWRGHQGSSARRIPIHAVLFSQEEVNPPTCTCVPTWQCLFIQHGLAICYSCRYM